MVPCLPLLGGTLTSYIQKVEVYRRPDDSGESEPLLRSGRSRQKLCHSTFEPSRTGGWTPTE